MTVFVIVCAAMVLAALVLIARPLIVGQASGKSFVSAVAVILAVPLVAAALYVKIGRWNWQAEIAATVSEATKSQPDVTAMIAKLEQRLTTAPNDTNGWLMLGRSYAALDKNAQAANAYQKAYDLSNGDNSEAALGLGESLIAVDENAITGRAAELFEAVLKKEPTNVKALWYGAMSALAAHELPRAHDRLQKMLALNPPDQIRGIIARQIQDIEQQLGTTGNRSSADSKSNSANAPASQAKKEIVSKSALAVQVSIDPKLTTGLDKKTPLFIAVRDPAVPGPPLAAVRRVVDDLPIAVTLTDNDAMMQGRGISNVARVQVVARVSKSGTPQAQPGDLYGEANVDIVKDKSVPVKIVIDRSVQIGGK